MFLRSFIKNGFLDAVGQEPDYWIILNAAGWMEKGVLTEPDLREIQAALHSRNGNEAASPADDGNHDGSAAETAEEAESPANEAEAPAEEGASQTQEEAPAEGNAALPVEGNGNE